MKLILERHAYAPELNLAHILRKGRIVASRKAPNCTTIRQCRKLLYARLAPAIVATVTSEYSEREFHWLNRTFRGCVKSRIEAFEFAKTCRAKNAGSTLLDGSTLPAATVKVKTRLDYVEVQQ